MAIQIPAGFKLVDDTEQPVISAAQDIPAGFKVVEPSQQPALSQSTEQPARPAEEPGIGEQFIGALDTAANVASTLFGTVAGGAIGATTAALPEELGGVSPQRGEEIQRMIENLATIRPQTEQGQRNLEAIGQNEFIKGIGSFIEAAQKIGGDFGFNLLDPVGKALGIEGLGALGGAVGSTLPEIAGLAVAGPTGRAVSKVAEGVKPLVSKVAQPVAEQLAAGGRELAEIAADTRIIMAPQQSAAKRQIAQLIQAESGDVSTAKFKIDPRSTAADPRLIADDLAEETIRQGFSDRAIASAKVANQPTKTKFVEMVNIMEAGKNNARFAAENRPADVIGRSVGDRINIIQKANNEAGRALDSKKMSALLSGKPVNSAPIGQQFFDDLDEMNIKSVDADGNALLDKDGNLTLDFFDSDIEKIPALKRIVSNIHEIMAREVPDALKLHRVKRIIDNQVSFGKKLQGLSGSTERVLKNLRRNIDQTLDNQFPEYRQINDIYSETIGALDAMQDVIGKKVDMSTKRGENSIGNRMRGVLSNNQNKEFLKQAAAQVDEIAKKYENGTGLVKRIGIAPKTRIADDLLDQVVFVDELDRRFGTLATTGFQGQIQQATEQAIRTGSLKSAGVDFVATKAGQVAEKIRKVNDKNAFKAARALFREGIK